MPLDGSDHSAPSPTSWPPW